MKILSFYRLRHTAARLLMCALSVAGVLTLTPQKAEAQWTVFDPTSYVVFGKIWDEDVSTGVKMAQTVQQGTQLISQGLKNYNLAMQETQFLEKGQILQAVGFAAQHAIIPGHPGWDTTMMTAGGLAAAGVTWQNMTNPNMSLQSRMAMLNSFATSSLNSLGSCNSAAINNSTALGSLQSLAISMAPANNTAASLGALNNMNQTQAIHYLQCQENLAEQRLKLQLIQAHESMDRDQYTTATNTTIDTYNGSGGGMWNVSPEQDYRLTGMH